MKANQEIGVTENRHHFFNLMREREISMKRLFGFVLFSLLLAGWQAWAQKGGISVSGAEEPRIRNALAEERWAITPQFGTMAYRTTAEGDKTKASYGVTFDVNFNAANESSPNMFIGGVTGVLYSRLGRAGSDFSGEGGVVGGQDAYVLQIPVNIKVGYDFTNYFRLSAHGGGNVMYRSVSNRMNLGVHQNGDSNWDLFPNIGADAEFSLGGNIGLTLRPDYTFTSAENIFTGTLGLLVAFR